MNPLRAWIREALALDPRLRREHRALLDELGLTEEQADEMARGRRELLDNPESYAPDPELLAAVEKRWNQHCRFVLEDDGDDEA